MTERHMPTAEPTNPDPGVALDAVAQAFADMINDIEHIWLLITRWADDMILQLQPAVDTLCELLRALEQDRPDGTPPSQIRLGDLCGTSHIPRKWRTRIVKHKRG